MSSVDSISHNVTLRALHHLQDELSEPLLREQTWLTVLTPVSHASSLHPNELNSAQEQQLLVRRQRPQIVRYQAL